MPGQGTATQPQVPTDGDPADLQDRRRWAPSSLLRGFLATDLTDDEAEALASDGVTRQMLAAFLLELQKTDTRLEGLLLFLGGRTAFFELSLGRDGWRWRSPTS